MTETLLLSDADVRSVVDLNEAYGAVRQAFVDRADGMFRSPERITVGVENRNAALLAMPASRTEPPALGVKLVSVFPDNRNVGAPTIRAVYVLFDPADGGVIAVLDAEYLTQIRTAAAAAVATHLLATDTSSTLIVGTGRQAWGHAHVFARVLGVRRFMIAGSSSERAEAFANRLRSEGLRADSCGLADVRNTRVIVTATSARTPLLRSSDVQPGTHINAVGTFQPDAAELPADLVIRSRVIVDTVDAVSAAGELAMPIAAGLLEAGRVSNELGDVVTGRKPGRGNASEITIYKSVGASFLDLAIAQMVVNRALKRPMARRFAFGVDETTPAVALRD